MNLRNFRYTDPNEVTIYSNTVRLFACPVSGNQIKKEYYSSFNTLSFPVCLLNIPNVYIYCPERPHLTVIFMESFYRNESSNETHQTLYDKDDITSLL